MTETQRDLSPAGSFPKWPQWPGLGQAEARDQELGSSAAFSSTVARSWIGYQHMGLKPVPTQGAGIVGMPHNASPLILLR